MSDDYFYRYGSEYDPDQGLTDDQLAERAAFDAAWEPRKEIEEEMPMQELDEETRIKLLALMDEEEKISAERARLIAPLAGVGSGIKGSIYEYQRVRGLHQGLLRALHFVDLLCPNSDVYDIIVADAWSVRRLVLEAVSCSMLETSGLVRHGYADVYGNVLRDKEELC